MTASIDIVDTNIARGPAGAVLRAENCQPWFEGQGFLEEARRIREQAQLYAQNAAEEAWAKGYEEGRSKGYEECVALLAKTKIAIDEYYASLEANLRTIVAQIITDVVGKLDAGEVIAEGVKKALASRDLGPQLSLRASPATMPLIRSALERNPPADAAITIALVPDPEFSNSECRLESEFVSIDLSIDTQLNRLAETLRTHGIGMRS